MYRFNRRFLRARIRTAASDVHDSPCLMKVDKASKIKSYTTFHLDIFGAVVIKVFHGLFR